MIPTDEVDNFDIFKDCLSTAIIQKLVPESGKAGKKVKGRKNEVKPVRAHVEDDGNYAAELAEFIEVGDRRSKEIALRQRLTRAQYLAEEIFLALPAELRSISYAAVQDDPSLEARYAVPLDTPLVENLVKPLPPTVADSLISYGLVQDDTDLEKFLEPAFTSYVTSAVSAPPEHTPAVTASRPDECEICGREQLPLTYHHLIPRAVHAKAVKRGWHKEWELQKVAWLCRACHSFVHKIATNEVLARELYSVELLVEREDVQRWAAWVGRVRWKSR